MSALRFLIALPKASGAQRGPALLRARTPSTAVTNGVPAFWCHSSERPLQAGRLTVIGTLFGRRASSGLDQIPQAVADRISASPAALIDDYWGPYLAVIGNEDGSISVVRDPSGALPCYVMETETHFVLASDLGTFEAAGTPAGGVQWERLFDHLQAIEIRRAETCVEGISELPPGSVTRFAGANRLTTPLWSPWPFTSPAARLAPGAAPAILRDVICTSVSALASRHRQVLVGLSGGLDSSIVCAALAAGGHDFTCLTLATSDASGDERPYAKLVAQAVGARLLEHHYDPRKIELARSASAHLPRPGAKPFMQEIERAYALALGAGQADAIFTGNGGDNVFCYLHSAAPIVDAIRAAQSPALILRTLRDMCAVTQCDLLTMTRALLSSLLGRSRVSGPDPSLLNAGRARGHISRALTPYMDDAPANLPGVAGHVRLLLSIQNFIEGYDRAAFPAVVPALLAQPIVETCLRIAPWDWCRGGINRSVAREAFEGLLPRPILRRVSKAGPESVTAAVFAAGRLQLRELLLGGLLRDHAIVDPVAVETVLDDPATVHGQMLYRILDIADAEAWARLRGAGVGSTIGR